MFRMPCQLVPMLRSSERKVIGKRRIGKKVRQG